MDQLPCPLSNDQLWGEASIPFRPSPVQDPQGNDVYIGWLPEYQGCENSGYSSGQLGPPGSDGQGYVSYYNYNYAWNAEVGLRSFWGKAENGNGNSVGWGRSCPHGYERSTWWWGAHCRIPSYSKFLGETCTDKSQCVNGFTERYLDTTCSPISPDPNEEWKCVFDEESGGGISLDNNICSCFGLLWCESDDCGGNQCVLSTYDMNKHCKYADEPAFGSLFGAGACSNSRTADDACEAFNGADAATTDSLQIGIEAGVVGIGCVVLLGAGLTVRKITQRRTMGPNSAEAEMAGKQSGTNVV